MRTTVMVAVLALAMTAMARPHGGRPAPADPDEVKTWVVAGPGGKTKEVVTGRVGRGNDEVWEYGDEMVLSHLAGELVKDAGVHPERLADDARALCEVMRLRAHARAVLRARK